MFIVKCHVVDNTSNDHLYQLERGDNHRNDLGNSVPQSPKCVVCVHDGVYHEVHHDEPPGWGGVLAERVPAVDQDGDVVIPVQEYKLLLPQDNEYGVAKFRNLKIIIDELLESLISHPNL